MSGEQGEPEEALSAAERAVRIKTLFERWLEEGLPADIVIPKSRDRKASETRAESGKITLPISLNQVMHWTAPEYGIYQSIGSKRYVSLKHKDFGKTAAAILEAITKLKNAKTEKRAPPKTEKAKRVAAVGLAKKYMALFVGVSKQFHEQGEQLSSANRDLAFERTRVEMVEDDLAQARKEVAALKQMLDRRNGALRVVD